MLRTVLGILILAISSTAWAKTWESTERLAQVAENAARSSQQAGAQKLQVSAQVDSRLKLPACGHYPKSRTPSSLRGTAMTVEVQCSQPQPWKLYVPVRVQKFQQVLVLNQAVQSGQIIDASMLRQESRDVARLPYGFVSRPEQVIGQQARRHLGAGVALKPQDLSARMAVRRGQDVTLIGRIDGLEIRMSGKALADGQIAQRIRVRNLSSQKVVEAIVRSAQEVEVLL